MMAELVEIFADARGLRAEASRARKLADASSGRLKGELYQLAMLYERIADGKDPDRSMRGAPRSGAPKLSQLARFFSAGWPD
jgi:hypothetical protein